MFKLNLESLTPYISILLISCFSNSVLAKPIDEYCVSKLTPEQGQFKDQNTQTNSSDIQKNTFELQSRKTTFFRGKEEFVVESRGGLDLKLRKKGETEIIQEINNFVQKDEWISYIFVTKDNWLFAHADFNNYMLDLNTPEPSLGYGKPIKIPFPERKCSIWKKFYYGGGCPVSSIYHSQTLGRAIISGYHDTDSGRKWTTVEIVAGEIKEISSPESIFTVVADVPMFGGSILRTRSNGALFYDGNKITELKLDLQKKRFSDQYPSWRVKTTVNLAQNNNIHSQRVYITNVQFGSEVPRFVIEIKKEEEVYTKIIPFAASVDRQDISQAFLSFPNEPHKWGTTSNSILFETSEKYQTVLKIPRGYYIPHQLRTIPHMREILRGKIIALDEPAIVFDVVHEKTKLSKTYYIKRVSSSANCDVILDLENPIELNIN